MAGRASGPGWARDVVRSAFTLLVIAAAVIAGSFLPASGSIDQTTESSSPAAAAPGAESSSGSGRSHGGATIRAVARPSRVSAGSIVTVEINARDLHDARAVAFHLVYDPSLLEPVAGGASEGGVLRRDGTATSFLWKPASTGDRIVVGIARMGDERGARGDGTLCRFTFKALAPGSTAVALDRAHLSGPQAADLPARFQPARLLIVPGSAHATGHAGTASSP